ncbi:cysteine desulfurase-like protein, partial [Vibrio sp. F13]
VEPATNIGPGRFETGTQSFEGLAGVIAAVDYLAQFGEPTDSLRSRLEQSYALYNKHESQLSEYFLKRLGDLEGVKLYGKTEFDSN